MLLVSGCASVSGPEVAPRAPKAPSDVAPAQPESVLEAPVEQPRRVERLRRPTEPSVPATPAVAALVRDAELSRSRGDLDKAASSLERAIRIQPRNPELWTRMAGLRLEQNQPTVAENLAKKSNVLAKGNRSLIQRNWALIAQARRNAGDSSGAAEAEARAGR